MTKALVLAPHQDDEVLGCGGTIAKLQDVQIVSLGVKVVDHAIRPDDVYREQACAAAKLLGVTRPVVFQDFETELFDSRSRDLMVAIANQIKLAAPEVVFVPWKDDVHQDHRATAVAARFGTRGFDSGVRMVLWYPVPGATESFLPDVYVPLDAEHVRMKRAAWEVYTEEQREDPHPRSWSLIDAQMRVYGAAIGSSYAEAFRLVRMTWDEQTRRVEDGQ